MPNLPILMRPARPEDQAFIYNSWLKAYRNSKLTREWPNEIYYKAQAKAITQIFFAAKTIIACSAEDKSQIYGYIVFQKVSETQIVHFLYVKQVFRRLGIGKSLVEKAFGEQTDEQEIHTTHWLPRCRKLGWKRFDLENPANPVK
jgi:ribosomal protein S18 acetylase RimI-like enzyme